MKTLVLFEVTSQRGTSKMELIFSQATRPHLSEVEVFSRDPGTALSIPQHLKVYEIWSLQHKLLKQPLVFHSHRK